MHNLMTPAHFICAIIFGLLTAYLSYKRKKDPYLWFLIGFFLGIVGLFAILYLPSRRKSRRAKKGGIAVKQPQERPLPSLPGPLDKFWYYLDPTHNQVGPMSHNAITKALHQGQISKTTYVWNEEMIEWKKLKDLI